MTNQTHGADLEAEARVIIDPNLRGGVPCVGATTADGPGPWPIAHLLQALADGLSGEQLTHVYSGLTQADVLLALEVGAWVLRDPAIDWAALKLPAVVALQRESRAWQRLSDKAWEDME